MQLIQQSGNYNFKCLYLKKYKEKFKISYLNCYCKKLGKDEQFKHRVNKRKEIIKSRNQ